MEEFVARHDLEHVQHVADLDGEVWEQFGIVAQPAWVFVDGESGETETVLGALPPDDLQQRLDALAG